MLGRGRTGSGKTVAFALPVIAALAASNRKREPRRPRAMVLVPTRELAKQVAMSPTSFHRHFRAATAMSPLQYQKQIRLQQARSRLLTNGADVAKVGFSVGYDSPSQFSREYSRLFGAPPGRDVARLRTASMADPGLV